MLTTFFSALPPTPGYDRRDAGIRRQGEQTSGNEGRVQEAMKKLAKSFG